MRAGPPTSSRVFLPVILSAALGLSGCMVGPDFERPDAPILDSWSDGAGLEIDHGTGFTSRSASTMPWWSLFQDATLNGLVQDAYGQNYDLEIAGVKIYQARAQLGIAIGELFPQQQQLVGAKSIESFSKKEPLFNRLNRFHRIDNHFTRVKAGFDAGWEIDLWGQIRRNIQSADAQLLASVASYDDAVVTITGDVAATYISIRELQQLIGISRKNAELQKQSLDIASLRLKDGVATQLDVDEATVTYNNTLSQIPVYETELTQAYNALSVLLGEPPGAVRKRMSAPAPFPKIPREVSVGIPADLLRRRPDIRQAEYQAAQQSAQIGVAIADFYPSFTLTGAIGVEASNVGDLFSPSSIVKAAGPGFTWNILNYGRILNNVRVQDALFQEAVLNYQNTVITAYSEVENALVAFVKSRQEARYLERSVRAAEGAAKLALEQYQQGTADYDRVVNTQESLQTAEERLVAARANELTNLIAVYKGLGGGWIPESIDNFVSAETARKMQDRSYWGRLLVPVSGDGMNDG
jgi:NodT family efflux transporter outer membrane factor (OMF) lipoprotein